MSTSDSAPRSRRRSIRLPAYDYASHGAYFVTICAHERQKLFENGSAKAIVESVWLQLPEHFTMVTLDEFIVMPNHVHGVIWIDEAKGLPTRAVGVQHAGPLRAPVVQSGSLGAIVRSFKAAATRELRMRGLHGETPVWQRNYYERVIRNDDELQRIREYIRLNPANWTYDLENPDHAENSDYIRSWGWIENP